MTYFKFLLCLLLSGCCLSTSCQAQEKRLPEAYTLRWTTYAGNSLPMITLLLSDGQLHKFVVDTGAPSSVIDSDVAKDLRLPIETVTFAGGSKYLLVKTPANFGPSVFQLPQLPLILTDLREFRKVDPSLHGILGTNVLDFFALAFDFSRQQLTFIPGGNVAGTPQELQGAHMLPLLSRDDHWWVEGSLDGLPVHFILDTGADSIAVEDPALLASFKPVRSIEGLPTIILVDESTRSMRVATKLLRLHRLTVGDMTLVDPVVQFVPRREKTTYNSLGIAFLQRYRVVLDFPAKKMYLAPDLAFQEAALKYIGTGAQFVKEGERVFVSKVTTPSPAQAAGLVVGDEVMTWGGQPVKKLTEAALQLFAQSKAGAEITLTFRHAADDKPKTITLKVVQLL